jgi:multidrug efflux pump subunit AcrA (membrane-fusion protein)
MKRFFTALSLSTALLAAAPVFAQDAPNPVQAAEAKSTLTTANAMINYGRANKDALAMIAGVQMMVAVAEGTTIESAGTPLDLGAVLDEAVALAGDDELIKAKAEALRDDAETKTRGACYWEYWCDWYGYCEYWYICY